MNWNYVGQLITLCTVLPLFLVVLLIDWPSDGWFIAALIAAGIVSVPLSWNIYARLQRRWKLK